MENSEKLNNDLNKIDNQINQINQKNVIDMPNVNPLDNIKNDDGNMNSVERNLQYNGGNSSLNLAII